MFQPERQHASLTQLVSLVAKCKADEISYIKGQRIKEVPQHSCQPPSSTTYIIPLHTTQFHSHTGILSISSTLLLGDNGRL